MRILLVPHSRLFTPTLGCLMLMIAAALDGIAQEKPDSIRYPIDVAAGKDVQYLADRNLPGVWKITEGKASVFFQAEKKFRTPLNAIRCVAMDGESKLLAGDSSSCNVFRFDEKGKPTPLSKKRIGIPMALAVDSTGRILIADLETHQILALPAEGGEPVAAATVQAPRGLAVDKEDQIWVVSHGVNQVVRIDAEGNVTPVVKGRPFQFPHHIAIDADGVAYVADGYGKTIWKLEPDKEPVEWLKGEPLDNPVGLSWFDNILHVADSRAMKLFAIDKEAKATVVVQAK